MPENPDSEVTGFSGESHASVTRICIPDNPAHVLAIYLVYFNHPLVKIINTGGNDYFQIVISPVNIKILRRINVQASVASYAIHVSDLFNTIAIGAFDPDAP